VCPVLKCQTRRQCLLRAQDADLRVIEHKGETRGWVGRLERQVSAAGFEDCEEGDYKVGGLLQTDADDGIGSDAEGAQELCELVGAFVELGIG
jgi:hypothetical protein